MKKKDYSRREFLKQNSLSGLGIIFAGSLPSHLVNAGFTSNYPLQAEPVIDIHTHTNYGGRTNDELLAHQRAMGITTTILQPAGRPVEYGSTYYGVANGLQAKCSGNDACYQFSQEHPKEFLFGSNEVPDLPEAIEEIEKYLKMGAVVIGECKFGVDCDSKEMQKIYELAQKFNVPILMHWLYNMYNRGFERFYTMLEKYPRVNFIGHSQTWWANVDKNLTDQNIMYPKTKKVTPGGLTDQLLGKYPNMFGDLSAPSGLNFLTRDEDYARTFLAKYQDKLLFGSDCHDAVGHGEDCVGAQIIAAIRRLSPSKKIERKLLYENAKRLFRL
ncbi:MAG: amidohydrolase 2 [Ferruginibacter sp.]|nr:amidohydrolase 2 [Ferruginibacter sp.]